MHVRTRMLPGAVLATVVALGNAQPSPGAEPDEVITYSLRATADPASPVTLYIDLALVQVPGAPAGYSDWQVVEIVFTQPVGSETKTWRRAEPAVGTPSGLWRVPSENPQLADFTLPPPMEGVAEADDVSQADLSFSMAGQTYTPPARGAPFPVTSALDYVMIPVGEPDPIEEGSDKPTETTKPG
ncbi:MAG: hypothetical protein HY763_01745 [Planctomycetes bacterium]|nr:hypothetical protein [Planctomycetota bacterium]